jgi:hypothetical protein
MSPQTSDVIRFPGASDTVETVGQSVFSAIQRAAAIAEENTQRALGVAHKLSLQLRLAEDRVGQLEAELQQARERAHAAEQWLHQVAAEIEQRFLPTGQAQPAPSRQLGPQDYAPRRRG